MKKDKLTIVIPSKNELFYIGSVLEDIAKQVGIKDICDKIVIADKSSDGTQCVIDIKKEQHPHLNIVTTLGGFVSEARNNGARLCETEYILFIDADVRFFSNYHIINTYNDMRRRNLSLYSCKVKSYSSSILSKIAFGMYNVIHHFLIKKYPFAIGAYMFVKYDDFVKYGMFNEKSTNSEDFLYSQNYKPEEFGVSKKYYIGQDDRRFKQLGYFGMLKHLIVNFTNYVRYGKEYFYRETNYWN
jgi:glycosyltransferase involved in cell wall biosynthesis